MPTQEHTRRRAVRRTARRHAARPNVRSWCFLDRRGGCLIGGGGGGGARWQRPTSVESRVVDCVLVTCWSRVSVSCILVAVRSRKGDVFFARGAAPFPLFCVTRKHGFVDFVVGLCGWAVTHINKNVRAEPHMAHWHRVVVVEWRRARRSRAAPRFERHPARHSQQALAAVSRHAKLIIRKPR